MTSTTLIMSLILASSYPGKETCDAATNNLLKVAIEETHKEGKVHFDEDLKLIKTFKERCYKKIR
jgi:hypothetical protein